MQGESLAIIIVILLMTFIFLRARKKPVALLTLPLVSVSLFYLLAAGLYSLLGLGISLVRFHMAMVLLGLVAGAAACSLLSLMIPTKKGKTGYLVFALGFQTALAFAYFLYLT